MRGFNLFLICLTGLVSFKVQGVTPTPGKSVGGFPPCVRPRDFSIGKQVALYEACVQKQEKFCESNEQNKSCQKMASPKADVIKTGPGSDTAAACAIQKDGSYKCEQEMVRFLVPEEVIQPLASPTGLPTLSEDGTVTAAPAASAAPAPGATPEFIPPPPPKGFSPK